MWDQHLTRLGTTQIYDHWRVAVSRLASLWLALPPTDRPHSLTSQALSWGTFRLDYRARAAWREVVELQLGLCARFIVLTIIKREWTEEVKEVKEVIHSPLPRRQIKILYIGVWWGRFPGVPTDNPVLFQMYSNNYASPFVPTERHTSEKHFPI